MQTQTLASRPELLDQDCRRAHRRAILPVSARDLSDQMHDMPTTSVSAGGLFCIDTRPHDVGSELTLQLKLPDGLSCVTVANVVRRTDSGVALRFRDPVVTIEHAIGRLTYAENTDVEPATLSLRDRFIRGEAAALNEIYRKYRKNVYAVAMRSLHDTRLAEEAVQQTFLQAWRAAPKYDRTRPIGPWLAGIARRASVDVFRRESRHRNSTPHEDYLEEAFVTPNFERTWTRRQVRAALDRLRDGEKQILMEAYFLGRTYAEIATSLGVPRETIKSRSRRASQKLAEILAHMQEA